MLESLDLDADPKIDEDAWNLAEKGWEKPIVNNDDNITVLKPEKDWAIAEKTLSKYNSMALSMILRLLSIDLFKQVQGCTLAKEA